MNALQRWRATLWPIPIMLCVLTIVGLLSGLMGDGAWDAFSWLGLGAPALIGTWLALRR